jgi:hypothetical protein
MMAVNPAQPFTQVWRFTNKSESAYAGGAKLVLVDAEQMQGPGALSVPAIEPQQTVALRTEMVAPVQPGTYQSSWQLQTARNAEPVAYSPMVIQDGCIIESAHPYENNKTETWMVTNPDEAALSTRVHFSQVDVKPGDSIVLKDGEGTERQTISGDYPTGLWSDFIPGRVVQVDLVTDSSETGWGFCLDALETCCLAYLPLIRRDPTPTPTPTPTPVPCLAESPHPYNNNMYQTWVVTNPDPNAPGSRVHFRRLELESNFDYLIVKDSSGYVYQRITGTYASGLWSRAVVGRRVYLTLDTDGSVTDWGFCVDEIITTGAPCSCIGHCSCDSQCTCDGDCSCNPYCTCDYVHYWYPN